jgi:tRNA A-37 threonylcarbamoyl transferase component Bud32
MIGTNVGAYRITGLLGEGGMGSVWNATHSMMGRDAVIKFLKPELSHHEEMVRRFFNEARAAASIEDPGIVNVFDVGKLSDGRAFIVMERLRGQSLAERLRQRRLGVEEAALLLRLLARSLGAAHANGIVHRDLKPDNIFLVADRDIPGGERTKILDFGIAKLAGGATMATRAGSIFGTPAYMAPEQCSDSAAVDHRADLYALGCIGYEMLAGTPPFGLGGLEILASQLRDEPAPLSSKVAGVPRGFEAVIHRLLAKDPNQRYPSCVELAAAIDALRIPAPGVLSSATVAAPTPIPMQPVAAPTPYPVVTPTPYLPPSHPPLTTHSAAAGMVMPHPTAPPTAAPPRGKGMIIGIGVAVAAIAVAAVAIVVMKGGDSSDAGAKKPLTASEQLEIAEAAYREERWDDAMLAAMKVLAIDDKHARAAELAEQARVEGEHAAAFKRMQKHAGVDDFPALAAAYGDIGEDSVYHDRADELRLAEQDAWLDIQLPALAALAEKGECGEHGRLLASVEHWVPPGEPRLVEARACNPAKATAPIDAGVAVAEVTPEKKKDKDRSKDKDKAKDGTTTEVKKDPPPRDEDEPAARDPDATLAEARSALKAKNYRAALKGAEQVLAARSDGEAQMIATVAACGLGNESKAKKHLPKGRSSYREISIHRCGVLGIELE